jgi:hypothetical protein
MKRLFFLLIGILAFCVACQDDFAEPESSTKSAKFEKTKTFQIGGWITIVANPEMPEMACNPVGANVLLKGSGWVSGQENILGRIDPENSTYETEYCELEINEEGHPFVYARTKVILQRMNGDKLFLVNHMWIDAMSGDISGYSDITDGTGRFEGAVGQTSMLNGTVDTEKGIGSWEEDGEITLVLK